MYIIEGINEDSSKIPNEAYSLRPSCNSWQRAQSSSIKMSHGTSTFEWVRVLVLILILVLVLMPQRVYEECGTHPSVLKKPHTLPSA